MKDTAEMLIETIEQIVGYDYKEAKEYATFLTDQCRQMYVEDILKEIKESL